MHIAQSGLVLAIVSANAYGRMPSRDDPIFRFGQGPIVEQDILGVKQHHVAEQVPLKITLRYAMQL